MLSYVEKHPEYKISFTVKTNKGSIRYDEIGQHHNVQEFLFTKNTNEHDLYTIKLSSQDRIGIGVFIKDQSSGDIFYDVRSGNDLRDRIGGFDDTFHKQHLNTQSGSIVYFYDNGDGDYIGVPIISRPIGQVDATKIVDLIQRYVSGERIFDGYDIMSLLQQRLYLYDPNRRLSPYNNRNNMVTINQNGDVTIGNDSYNIFAKRQELINRISSMSNSTPSEMLNKNMSSDDDQVLYTARQKFANNSQL